MNRFRLVVAIVLLLAGLAWFGQGTGLVGGAALAVVAAGVAWTARRPARG